MEHDRHKIELAIEYKFELNLILIKLETYRGEFPRSGVTHFIHVAPHPVFSRFDGPYYGVFGGMKVFGGVLVLGGVAATHVAAHQAQAEMDPGISHLQALFAAAGVRLDMMNLLHVNAFRHD